MATSIVIFGASGDLTRRKLIPALFSLHLKKRLPEGTRIIGSSRTTYSSEQWRELLGKSTAEFRPQEFDDAVWHEFAQRIHYLPVDVNDVEDVRRLGQSLSDLEQGPSDRLYYLATKPELYGTIVENLGAAGMAAQHDGSRRIVIEKPFGRDLKTAAAAQRAGPCCL